MTTQPRKPDLFDFNDFRAYLADWYDYQCTTPVALTKAEICRQLGLPNSRSYFGDVLSGKYVSPPKVKLFVKLLAFDDDQSRFFKTLVDYNQCLGDPDEKEWLLEQIIALNRTPKKVLDKHELAYYANWYHSVIRTLLGIIDFGNDYAALGRLLQPAITTRQARVLAYANYIF